jgi:hypothetical protein
VTLISEPTRTRENQRANILDLVITNNEEIVNSIEMQNPLGNSDHASLLVDINFCPAEMEEKERYLYRKADLDSMRNEIKVADWENMFGEDSVEENWNSFLKYMTDLQDRFVPKVKPAKHRKSKQPWVSQETREMLKMKKKAYRKFRKSKTEENWRLFKEARNKANCLIQRDKRDYELAVAEGSKTNPKLFWNYVNSKTKIKQGVCDLEKENGTLTEGDREKANTLNSFFTSVFTKEDQTMPDVTQINTASQEPVKITEDIVLKKTP